MPHCTLYFEDTPEGLIDFRCDWFQQTVDPKSPSHNIASQIISWMNERAERAEHAKSTLVQNQDGVYEVPDLVQDSLIKKPTRPGIRVPV